MRGYIIQLIIVFAIAILINFLVKKYTEIFTDYSTIKNQSISQVRFPEKNTETRKIPFIDEKPSFALEINGDDEFKTKIKEAIRLLWLYDKDNSFMILRRYIFEIRLSDRTTFYFDGEKPIIEISKDMYENSSLTYLASIIAHNAWHGWYFTEKKLKKRNKEIPPPGKESNDLMSMPPPTLKSITKEYQDMLSIEDEAFNYQMQVLKKINAPISEINRIKKRQPKDFSPAHDGRFIIQF